MAERIVTGRTQAADVMTSVVSVALWMRLASACTVCPSIGILTRTLNSFARDILVFLLLLFATVMGYSGIPISGGTTLLTVRLGLVYRCRSRWGTLSAGTRPFPGPCSRCTSQRSAVRRNCPSSVRPWTLNQSVFCRV